MTRISAGDLKLHWGILDFELLKFIRNGLSAYDRFGRRTITESQVEHEKEETLSELRQRLYLRERKHEAQKIEKNNSAEYRANAQRLGIELPPPEIYNDEKIRQRVEARIAEEYDRVPSFPVVPLDQRLIPDELKEFDLRKLLREIKTFHFKIQDINRFAQLHGLKIIDDADPATDQENQEEVEHQKADKPGPEPPPQTVGDYIRDQRAKAKDRNMIAYELQKQYGLSALDIARALGLDAGLNKTQIGAMKKRGERAIKRGKKMME